MNACFILRQSGGKLMEGNFQELAGIVIYYKDRMVIYKPSSYIMYLSMPKKITWGANITWLSRFYSYIIKSFISSYLHNSIYEYETLIFHKNVS